MPRPTGGKAQANSFSDEDAALYGNASNPMNSGSESSTGKFSPSRPSPPPLNYRRDQETVISGGPGQADVGVMALLLLSVRECCTAMCVDHRAEELVRLRIELVRQEKKQVENEADRDRKDAAREISKLQQALEAAEGRANRAESALSEAKAQLAANSENALSEAKAQLAIHEMERKVALAAAALLESEAREKERLREEDDVREKLRSTEKELEKFAAIRRQADINAIKEAQTAARLGRVPVPSTPSSETHTRSYSLASSSIIAHHDDENDEDGASNQQSEAVPSQRFTPPPPRRPL